MKIGQLVKTYIPNIINYCQSQNHLELDNLQDKNYSKQTLGINFPFIVRAYGEEYDQEPERYWKKVYTIGAKDYRFCSQWIYPQRHAFLDYLKKLGLIDGLKSIELNEKIEVERNKKLELNKKSKYPSTSNQQTHLLNQQTHHNEDKLAIEASEMSVHYRKFYYLERSLRALIEEVMSKHYGDKWWTKVDYRVNKNVDNNLGYELSTTHTKRSDKKIDYTTFGDLRKIINNHWFIFEPKFKRNLSSVNEVLIDLNRIRSSIAHCTPLAKKEVTRFEIRIDDWKNILN